MQDYKPSKPYRVGDTVYAPLPYFDRLQNRRRSTSGGAFQVQNLPRKVNQAALAAMNQALGAISSEGYAYAHWKRRSGCRSREYCPICIGGWRRLQKESTRI